MAEAIVNTRNEARDITVPNLKLYYRPIVIHVAQCYHIIGITPIEKNTEPRNKLKSLELPNFDKDAKSKHWGGGGMASLNRWFWEN